MNKINIKEKRGGCNEAVFITNSMRDYANEHGININMKHITKWDLRNDLRTIYVYTGDELVGGLTFTVENQWLWFCCLYVLPEYRGKGICSEIFKRISRICDKEGLHGINASTYTFEAPWLYEHYGFTKGCVLKDCPKGNTSIDYYEYREGSI